jgi:hypothetical protein
MVFTVAQWNSLQRGDFVVSAAGIGPRELGRNVRYVFALPPRCDFADLPGMQEVETILEGNLSRHRDGDALSGWPAEQAAQQPAEADPVG